MTDTILCIGECMVELRQTENGSLRKGFAGDTFNTAYYLSRYLDTDSHVEYLTAVGTDTISDEMVKFIEAVGIGTRFIRRLPERSPGLYMIHLNHGERSFSYWRSTSAARLLANDRDELRAAMDAASVIFFSGVTLAILSLSARHTLLAELARARVAGKMIVFDPNIRLSLWEEADVMRHTITAAARSATLVMPSFDDEATHFGDASVSATISRYRALGIEKLVVKNGSNQITAYFDGVYEAIPVVPAAKVIDSTGAGDSFNGVFLAIYLATKDYRLSVRTAAEVAALVISRHGALVERDGTWPLRRES